MGSGGVLRGTRGARVEGNPVANWGCRCGELVQLDGPEVAILGVVFVGVDFLRLYVHDGGSGKVVCSLPRECVAKSALYDLRACQ
jgi:hypothetical protein